MDIKLEETLENGKYTKNDEFDGNNDKEFVWSISGGRKEDEKVYTYDEAINLTGNGWYNIGLLTTLLLAILSMALDMFGFTFVVAAARCDLQLSHSQTSFLLSVPFMGTVTSAYVHGFISDTCGRKRCLVIALWGSFLVASLGALSPNFTVLTILKFFGSSMCSGVHSLSYTLISESCSVRTKGKYIIILSSSVFCSGAVFTGLAYVVLSLEFSYNLGFIIFKPWRLLILTLAMGLGSSALLMQFFYESPKYLINAGRNLEALDILRKIRNRNGGADTYPVKKILLLDACPTRPKHVPFVQSLWDQIAPLFQPPLLQKTLLLFYILATIYSINNAFYVWFPILLSTFFDESTATSRNGTESFCKLINLHTHGKSDDCIGVVSLEILMVAIVQGVVLIILNCGAVKLAHRRKIAIIVISVFTSVCCIALIFVTEKIAIIAFYLCVRLNCIAMGMTFCYIVDLFPTSYRGMITSLGVMVARGSALVGVNLVGAFMFTHCTASLYSWGAYAFSGALMAILLPPDRQKKK